jgi:hypothetical protein
MYELRVPPITIEIDFFVNFFPMSHVGDHGGDGVKKLKILATVGTVLKNLRYCGVRPVKGRRALIKVS